MCSAFCESHQVCNDSHKLQGDRNNDTMVDAAGCSTDSTDAASVVFVLDTVTKTAGVTHPVAVLPVTALPMVRTDVAVGDAAAVDTHGDDHSKLTIVNDGPTVDAAVCSTGSNGAVTNVGDTVPVEVEVAVGVATHPAATVSVVPAVPLSKEIEAVVGGLAAVRGGQGCSNGATPVTVDDAAPPAVADDAEEHGQDILARHNNIANALETTISTTMHIAG